MESQSELGLERPPDLTVDGDAPEGVVRRAFLMRSAVAGAVAVMYQDTSAGGLAVAPVLC
jgi:hypothetical protein